MDMGDYDTLFQDFYEKGKMASSYKCVFLHALTDVGLYEEHDLIGREWIKRNDANVILDLNFIAVRFIHYYLEIVNQEINHVNPGSAAPNNNVNIISLIKEEKIKNQPLESLTKPALKDFRKKIIKKSIIAEVVKNLKNEMKGLYQKTPSKDTIEFDSNLLDYFTKNASDIKEKLSIKLKLHLERHNKKKKFTSINVNTDSPFYMYCKQYMPSLFLIEIDESANKNYEKSVRKKINSIKYELKTDGDVCVWGIQDTVNNYKIWNKLKTGDHVLFVRGNVCFEASTVKSTINDERIATRIWGQGKLGTSRKLLIIIEDTITRNIDLSDPRVQVVNPIMPLRHGFSIIAVNEEIIDKLVSTYESLKNAFERLNRNDHLLNYNQTDFEIEREKRLQNSRKGQKLFRNMVLKNYSNRCAVCGIRKLDLLEASHIMPVANKDTSGDIDNGICLCVLHHKMFDSGYMYFTDEYEVKLSEKAQDSKQLVASLSFMTHIQGCSVLPSRNLLKKHRNWYKSKMK